MRTISNRVARFVCAAALALGAGGLGLSGPGCSSGASVSGAAFFNTRIIKLGETLDIRLPFDRTAGLEWTIESYDSLYLGYEGRTYAFDDDDSGTLIVRFLAKTPGETALTLRRRYSTGGSGESQHNFTINILQN